MLDLKATSTNAPSEQSTTAPSTKSPNPATFQPPKPEWLSGTWYIIQSTLPMWKTKRNVDITYKPLPPTSDGRARFDDTVTYQTMMSNKVKVVRGIDTASSDTQMGAWDWRGKGLLSIASSHWAVLTWADGKMEEQWVVTYFKKTLFTPAGIDIYSRKKGGLRDETIVSIKEALKQVEDREVRYLAAVLFKVQHD